MVKNRDLNNTVEKIRDDALRRAMNTPPQHKVGKGKESKVSAPASADISKKRGRAGEAS